MFNCSHLVRGRDLPGRRNYSARGSEANKQAVREERVGLINPRRARMRSEGYGTWSVCVCVCVCLCVDDYSRTVGNEAAGFSATMACY